MPKIRTIKPEMKSSETVAKLSIYARLLFIWLITEADDEGRLLDNAKTLSGTCFPLDDDIEVKDVSKWLEEIADVGLIRRYRRDEKSVIQITGWSEHQKIQPTRKSKSLFKPEFDDIQDFNRPIDDEFESEFDDTGDDYCGNALDHGTTRNIDQIHPQVTLAQKVGHRHFVAEKPTNRRHVVCKSSSPTVEHGTWNMDQSLADRRDTSELHLQVPLPGGDELFVAVCEATHRNSNQMTKSARGSINRAVAELRAVNASSEEVHARAAVYHRKFPNAVLSPSALTKHWDSLIPVAAKGHLIQTSLKNDLSVRVQIDPSEHDESKWPTIAEIQGIE